MVFLNPERVERQGGQNQLCERSPEKGLFKEKLEEKTKGKIPHGFSETWAMFAGPSGQARIQPKRPQYPYPYTLDGRTPPQAAAGRRSARTLSALRKKRSEGYIAKENRPKGALIRKLIFLQPLRPKAASCARDRPKRVFLKRNLKRKLKEKSRTDFFELGPF